MTPRLPDFIIGGAPRSGTTFLYEACASHQQVFMARRNPEPKFFLVDEEYERGVDYYAETYFTQAPPKQVLGEKSTNYLESPIAADRIAVTLPQVKLIFVLRDPIERALSNWRWSTFNGLETLSFEDAIEHEADREKNYRDKDLYRRPFSYMSRGNYPHLLAPYMDRFSYAQILVLDYATMISAFEDCLKQVADFLSLSHDGWGIDKSFTKKKINATPAEDTPITDRTRSQLVEKARPWNEKLRSLTGLPLKNWSC